MEIFYDSELHYRSHPHILTSPHPHIPTSSHPHIKNPHIKNPHILDLLGVLIFIDPSYSLNFTNLLSNGPL